MQEAAVTFLLSSKTPANRM